MRRAVLAIVILAALGGAAHARPAPFPTFGGGLVTTTADDNHGFLWAGVAVRPTSGLSGHYLAAAVDLDFYGDVTTVVPTVRVGWTGFLKRQSVIPMMTTYWILGYGKQRYGGEVADSLRIGSGLCMPFMLYAAEFGIAAPTTFEVVLDTDGSRTAWQFRLGWGF